MKRERDVSFLLSNENHIAVMLIIQCSEHGNVDLEIKSLRYRVRQIHVNEIKSTSFNRRMKRKRIFVRWFKNNVADRQTDRQTDKSFIYCYADPILSVLITKSDASM